ncbi:BTB/POZ protein [Rhizophagus clarus]|uniref:BTB/POZ protein n=1 Tax=Rhizophagus clarus TaxID=94130 RepID=A0A8H3LTQ0_9GLOM|nr:BTB/POZ protein [Rhizophagus clarus]
MKLTNNNYTGDMDWEKHEQNESLTTRIKNIIKDYSINSLFKEFLQNADDAKATRFKITVDERRIFQHNGRKYLSEEMEDWQGPAIWIYNDAEFSPKDFQALIKLGTGGKSNDETKIGRFGIGFNCAFHITDLPSFVSGRYIVFLDPNAKYLPTQGYPPRRPRGTRIDFIGTLFRLPLRTSKTAKKSEISDQVFEIRDILQLFNGIQSNKEMLFLRNIESCSFYHMRQQNSQLIWEAQINMSDKDREIRKSVTDTAQLYQMDIEIIRNNKNNKKVSEIWLLCTGGNQCSILKQDLKGFSEKMRLKPRGGVASLLAQSDRKSFAELRAESFPNPPELKGEIYSYLSLSICTNLGVHLNGNFSLSSPTPQSENDFLQADCDDAKWNRYILYDVLPLLHSKLLDEVVRLEEIRYNNNRAGFIPHTLNNLWPITKNLTMGLYKSYGANVIKNGNNRIYWTEANGGKFISLREGKIIEGEETMIGDILGELGISVLKLDKEKLEQIKEIAKNKRNLDFKYKIISGKEVCGKLRGKDSFMNSFMRKNSESILLLLRFILSRIDVSFENLYGLQLVPLNDGSVGTFGKIYYVGKRKHIDLFPNVGPSKFVRVDLPHDLEKVFKRDELSVLNIRQFDSAATLDLLFLEFPYKNIKELDWDPNGNSIPNDRWLKEIWSKLMSSKTIEFAKLSKLPLLPMIQPSEKLVQLDITNPLLNIEHASYLYPVLKKLKLRFTNMKFPDNANSNLKQCVLPYNPVNIVNVLERNRILLNLTMEQLFKTSYLSNKDYEMFRIYIKDNHEDFKRLIQNQEFLNILRSLPIWPVHSCDDKFIDAESGILLPHNLPFFSFQQNDDFYKCDEFEFRILFGLNVTYIDEEEYFKDYFIPHHINTTPSRNYITFMQRILSLGKREIERYFELYPLIPNKSLTALVKANTLYDITVPLFCNVFEGSDNFLPTIFYSNTIWVTALKRIGLKYQVNCKTIIECAREIESQFQNDQYPTNVVRYRAKSVIDYLYEHTETLNFSSGQWSEIMQIKFVPSEKNFQNSLYEDAKETSGYESFAVLCFQRYKEVCWTQKPLFDKSVEPNDLFLQRRPKIGKPSPKDVINHWSFVIEKIKSKSFIWKSSENYSVVKKIIQRIYEIMNEFSKEDPGLSIDAEEKLFLNGEDPFDEENWIAGSELVFGLKEDVKGYKYEVKEVKEYLMPYKDLLILAGAHESDFKSISKTIIYEQKDVIINSLINKLIKEPDDKFHDVVFIVGEEKVRIGANKYVLSAASTHFEKIFYGGLSETTNNEINVPINIQPDTFRRFLQVLYGQSIEEIIKPILFKADDYLTFLFDLLKLTEFYNVELIKNKIEDIIIKGQYININNICKIIKHSKECNAQRLRNYYEEYIKLNKKFIKEQLLELCKNATNYEEILEISQKSQMLDSLLK